MISSDAIKYGYIPEIAHRNYVAMSFHLIDASESGLKFSLVGYALHDGLEFARLGKDANEFENFNGDWPTSEPYCHDIDYLSARCPICGSKAFAEYDSITETNKLSCGDGLCRDILSYFGCVDGNLNIDKSTNNIIGNLAKKCGIKTKDILESLKFYTFDNSVSDALASRFLQGATKDKLIARNKVYEFREIESKYGIKVCNLSKAQNENQTLYGIKFPKAIEKGLSQYVPKSKFYEWAKNCNREIKEIKHD